jgi:hypothetical protein
LLQKENELKRQHEEDGTFDEATRKIWSRRAREGEAAHVDTGERVEERMEDLVKQHQVEREQLEACIDNWHKPPVSSIYFDCTNMYSAGHILGSV